MGRMTELMKEYEVNRLEIYIAVSIQQVNELATSMKALQATYALESATMESIMVRGSVAKSRLNDIKGKL